MPDRTYTPEEQAQSLYEDQLAILGETPESAEKIIEENERLRGETAPKAAPQPPKPLTEKK